MTTGSEVVLSQDNSGGRSCRSWRNRLQSQGSGPSWGVLWETESLLSGDPAQIIAQSVCLISDFYSALCNINPRACFLRKVIVVTSVA